MSTKIQWCTETWNCVIGCTHASEGCRHCYAEGQVHRFGARYDRPTTIKLGREADALTRLPVDANGKTLHKGAQWTGAVWLLPDVLELPLRRRKPTTYFVNSLADWAHESIVDSEQGRRFLAAMFGVMAACPQHTFQLLTKRPEQARLWFADLGISELVRTFKHVAIAGRIGEVFAEERSAAIVGWPGYFVTTRGQILSDRTKAGARGSALHEIAPMVGASGHGRVMLYNNGDAERFLVHRLVLDAFDRPGPPDEQGCHIDGDATNNALWNLRWGSQSDNWDDRKRHGNRRAYAKLTEDQVEDIRRRWIGGPSTKALAAEFGVSDTQIRNIGKGLQWGPEPSFEWPLPGVWIGCSVEDQAMADERIPALLDLPAAVRFISAEPLLGPVNFRHLPMPASMVEPRESPTRYNAVAGAECNGAGDVIRRGPKLDWVIAGGESGPKARPCAVAWIRSIIEQCKAASVPVFVKQLGARPLARSPEDVYGNAELDMVANSIEFPAVVPLGDAKGGSIDEWPADLRVREMPK